MARLLSWPLVLVLVVGYSLAPAAAHVALSHDLAEHSASSIVAAPEAAATIAPAQTEPEPTAPPPTPTQPPATPTPPAATPTPTPKPTKTPAATTTPKPTKAPGATPKPTIPPKPSPSPGVVPAPVKADVFARVVNAGSVLLREAPKAGAKGVVRAPKGQIVGITGATGKWYQATFRGKVGYAPKGRLQVIGLVGEKLAKQYPRIIVVDRRRQHMEVYQNGQLMLISAVTTGRPELPTPTGMFKVMGRESPHLFRSPWPETSQFWYPPGWADYTVLFRSGGFYFHDTRARPNNGYGIGTDVPHKDPDGVQRTGSRGCVNTPWWAMQQLYGWARRGDVVAILDVQAPKPPTPPGGVVNPPDPPSNPTPTPTPNPTHPPPQNPPPPIFRTGKGYWGYPGYSFE